MPDVFRLNGSYTTRPTTGNPSGAPEVEADFDERVGLRNKTLGFYELSVDTPVPVNLGGLTNVAVLVVKAVGGKVTVRLTSADGTTQAVPVDSFLALIDLSVPVTAIDLTRVPGVSTTVNVFLGERG